MPVIRALLRAYGGHLGYNNTITKEIHTTIGGVPFRRLMEAA